MKNYFLLFTICLVSVVNIYGQLATPSLMTPTNGSNYIGDYVSLRVTSPVAGASKYIFEVDTVEQFNSPFLLRDSTAALTSPSINILKYGFDKHYFWRAKAKNDTMESAWSSFFTFSTAKTILLTSPADGEIVNSINPTMQIVTLGAQPQYRIEVDTVADFSSSYFMTLFPTNSQPFSQLLNAPYGKTYYWRAWATTWGDTSEYSETRTFSIPAAPKLISPANASTGMDTSVTFNVSNISGSLATDVLISDDSLFSNPTLYTSGNTFRNLKFGTTYYWKSRKSRGNNFSEYSETFTFTTKFQLNAPTITLPQVNAIIKSDTVLFSWLALPISSGLVYEVQLDTVNTFFTPSSFFTNEIQIPITNLNKNKTYFYRVRGLNDWGNGAWSNNRMFELQDNTSGLFSSKVDCELRLNNHFTFYSPCFSITEITVFSIDGKLMDVIIGDQWKNPGDLKGLFIVKAKDNLGRVHALKVNIVE